LGFDAGEWLRAFEAFCADSRSAIGTEISPERSRLGIRRNRRRGCASREYEKDKRGPMETPPEME
jgi:hypothetical protein